MIPFTFFVSSTSKELAEHRELVGRVLGEAGAEVLIQTGDASSQRDRGEIERAIASSTFSICLIGHERGEVMPRRSTDAWLPESCSWTQYEYLYAGEQEIERRGTAWPHRRDVYIYEGHDERATVRPPQETAQQKAFRERAKSTGDETPIHQTYLDIEELEGKIKRFLVNSKAMSELRRAQWDAVKARYRADVVARWVARYPASTLAARREPRDGVAPPTARPPFIEDQALEMLQRDGTPQKPKLKPEGFVSGRDTETEATFDIGEWPPVEREGLIDSLVPGAGATTPGPRLFLISGGGIGKTTNLEWACAEVNARGSAQTAIALKATQVAPRGAEHARGDRLIEALLSELRFTSHQISDPEKLVHDRLPWEQGRVLLEADRDAGRITVMIDGLDHVTEERRNYAALQTPDWARCPAVLAGRPHVLLGWSEAHADASQAMDAERWTFIRPGAFSRDQQERYLGQQRYALVPGTVVRILSVPRVLEYVARLPDDSLRTLQSAADAYYRAVRHLIIATVEGHEIQLDIGRSRSQRLEAEPQTDYIMSLFGALAYRMMSDRVDVPREDRERLGGIETKPNFDSLKLAYDNQHPGSDADVLGDVRRRIQHLPWPNRRRSPELFANDLKGLAAFSTVAYNGVLDSDTRDEKTLVHLVWDNRSVQSFFCAYWMSKHGTFPDRGPTRDSDSMRRWVYYPERKDGDYYYEVNLFLAEMPSAAINPEGWARGARAWFDPSAGGEPGTRRWSAEMLYRCWWTMHAIAGEPVDDWWDAPFDAICATGPAHRSEASPHQKRDARSQYRREHLQVSAGARTIAREALAAFRGDLGLVLAGKYGREFAAASRSFTDAANWVSTPGADAFEMGAVPGADGFPRKTRRLWEHNLAQIREGKDPERLAEEQTPVRWFTGAQGTRLRAADIRALTAIFQRYRTAMERNVPDGLEAAMNELENQFRTRDQVPVERRQTVGAFSICRVPVLNRWFWLFAGGHRASSEEYLQSGGKRTPEESEHGVTRADHPAIYISWYDAWAFCQWATWTEDDPDQPGREITYRCRLPHEPEWEFAARHGTETAVDGSVKIAPPGQPYWWGHTFYEHPDSPEEERISNPRAHALGRPGETRAPETAQPNGLGLCDVLGNVWEWCANPYDRTPDAQEVRRVRYSRHFPGSGQLPATNAERSMRGGLWYYLDLLAECSDRFRLTSNDRDYKMGFRPIRERLEP